MNGPHSPPIVSIGTGLSDQRWRVVGICVVLAAITFIVFGQTLTHGFVDYDDEDYVYENPVVARGLTITGVAWAFDGAHAGNWHPLAWLSHMLDCQLYGLNPAGHHLTSVLLHAATVIALFLVLRQMTGSLWRSAFVAAVFAIHPLRVESVAWVAERKDVLSGLFFILTIGAYVRYARLPWSAGRYGLVLLLFAIGLMSKPMLVTLPLVLLLLDYWPLRRAESAGKLVMEKLPLLFLSAASCGATLLAQTENIQPTVFASLPLRAANAVVSCMVYLGQMIYPAGLAAFYPFPHNGLPAWETALAGTLLAGLSVMVVWQRRKQPWLLTGWLWYLVMLLPVAGIIQVGGQAHADRYTYLPQIGIYVAITWLVAEWRLSRAAIGSLMAGALAVLIVCAWKQTAYWQDSETLATRALACTQDNYIAHEILGNVFMAKGRVDEAIPQFQQALQIKADDVGARVNLGNAFKESGKVDDAIAQYQQALQINSNYANAHNNLGIVLLQKGKVDEAISHFQKALQINPDYAEVHYNLGKILLQKGKVDEAIAQFQNALQIKPDYLDAHTDLGQALFQEGKLDEAITQFQIAVQINPGYAEGHSNLGIALGQKGRVDEAIAQYEEALQIKPDFAPGHFNLGVALLQEGRVDEAIPQLQKALQLNPDNAEAHVRLGNALLQKGNVVEAIVHFQRALQIDPAQPVVENNLAWLLAVCSKASVRNGGKAVELARQANAQTGGENPIILHTLAAAYAEAGRFSDAVETARHALRLAGAQSNPGLAGLLESELKLYQAGKPFHIPAQKMPK